MHINNLDRAQYEIQAMGLPGVLVTDPSSITWLCGHVPFDTSGPSPFAGGPALAWLGPEQFILLVPGSDSGVTVEQELERWTYRGYTVDKPMNPHHYYTQRFQDLVRSILPHSGTIAIEYQNFPASLHETLVQTRPEIQVRPIDGLFTALRAIKTEYEIEKIRGALRWCDLAQQVLMDKAQPEMTELDLFGAIYGELIPHAGGPFPVTSALVGGVRTGARLPGPSHYRLQAGDPILFDIALNYQGYWGDNCNTLVLGAASEPFEKLHGVVFKALEFARALISPGIRASEIDARVRAFIRDRGYEPYAHHTGHGIGVSYHEAPRIVPYNHETLAAGMVICLEPGIYDPLIGGVRLEDVVLVTENGCEVLSRGGRALT